MKRYTLRPDVQLECVYIYRDPVDFRRYALNIVLRC